MTRKKATSGKPVKRKGVKAASMPKNASSVCDASRLARGRVREDASFPAAPPRSGLPAGYGPFLSELKDRIRASQIKAALSVNSELIALYWEIGVSILKRQRDEGWGAKVIERLALDLHQAFPDMQGFSKRNLLFMRAFAEAYPDAEIVKQVVSLLPWGHNIRLLQTAKDPDQRLWYARQTIENGWSRAVLVHQIESGLHERQGKAQTNFKAALPPPQSDLAAQVLKDPYNFDFLTLGTRARERELEHALVDRLQRFLLELGKGFAFVGRQVHLEVEGEDFYIDLLFYHLQLRCYVVIDLKAVPFKPEFTGKMNFYLSAVDDLLRHPEDRPSIGLILCKAKKQMIVEYALRNLTGPIGVSAYRLTQALPEEMKASLPTIEDLEAELGKPNE